MYLFVVIALLNFISIFFQIAYHHWAIAIFNLVGFVLCTVGALGQINKE
jgi:hypothetical protein